ncbi:MAG TPA: hypothetical protein VKB86_14720 [Pyrinomonadaceae bacterium]|nr:hypothetical protein [Pyrinomonadaceae bacterium]
MTKRRMQLLSLVAVLLSILSVTGFARFKASLQESAKTNSPVSDPLIKEIANHRQWTRANEKPIPVFNATLAG